MNFGRLPKDLQATLKDVYHPMEGTLNNPKSRLDCIYIDDARSSLGQLTSNSVNLSVWSPPYFVGKEYEEYLDFTGWKSLLSEVIRAHFRILCPGGFLAINIADILVFRDEDMPKIQADVVHRKKISLTKEDIVNYLGDNPNARRQEIAAHFNCSEQTIDRRLNGNNIRGGKSQVQTRVKIVGGLIEKFALDAGLYTYDRRIWAKDAAWENSRWASLSYRSVDEFEYIYIFWKPGVTKYDRKRLTSKEWKEWGSRGVWNFPSVRANDNHSAKFPSELPRRLIQMFTDPKDVVLDCFLGSGTTAYTAKAMDRSFIGIELDEKYAMLAASNIQKKTGFKPQLIKDDNKPSHITQ